MNMVYIYIYTNTIYISIYIIYLYWAKNDRKLFNAVGHNLWGQIPPTSVSFGDEVIMGSKKMARPALIVQNHGNLTHLEGFWGSSTTEN